MNKLFRYHPRIWIATATGVVLFFILPQHWTAVSRLLVAWNAGASLFLVLIYRWMTHLSAERMRSRYEEEDGSAPVILSVVVLAALLSVVAIVAPLGLLKQESGMQRFGHMALAADTLINSWVLVPTMFTTHYADMFYSTSAKDRPLTFPNTALPGFWDFAYFSFTIAAACQTSDVSTASARVRKVVTVHTLISFLFNASILGFAINVTAGLIGGN